MVGHVGPVGNFEGFWGWVVIAVVDTKAMNATTIDKFMNLRNDEHVAHVESLACTGTVGDFEREARRWVCCLLGHQMSAQFSASES